MPTIRSLLGLERRDDLGNPNVPIFDVIQGITDGLSTSGTGISLSPERAMKQGAFFSCVNILAKTIAATELYVYKRNGKSRQLVTDDPRFNLLHDDPNPEMTAYDMLAYVVLSLAIWGNAYVWMEDDGDGNTIALWPLNPRQLERGQAPDGSPVFIFTENNEQNIILPGDMMVFHSIGLETDRGLAPYQVLRDELGIVSAQTDSVGRLYQNGARPGGWYTIDKPMTDDQFKAFIARQKMAHEGLKNSHKVGVLPQGISYTESSFNPSNLSLTDARTHQYKAIAMVFSIPPRMLGINDGTSTYASVEMDSINFVTHCLRPWFINIQQTIRKNMFNTKQDKALGLFVEFDTAPLLTPDSISRAKVDQSDRMFGVKTSNELREARGLEPIEGGDILWMPQNLTPLDEQGLPMFNRLGPEPAPGLPGGQPAPNDPLTDPLTDPSASDSI